MPLRIRENHLRYYVDEVEVDGNIVYAIYLRNLIFIERQTNMHKNIRKYTCNKKSVI